MAGLSLNNSQCEASKKVGLDRGLCISKYVKIGLVIFIPFEKTGTYLK